MDKKNDRYDSKKKYIQLVLFVLLFSLGACNSDEMSDINDTTEVQEQMVLKLSVQQESVVYTRGTGTLPMKQRLKVWIF